MRMSDIAKAIEQLSAQGKKVIAINQRHVMCHWHMDESYVSWRWYIVDDKVVVEIGHYYKDEESCKEDFDDRV